MVTRSELSNTVNLESEPCVAGTPEAAPPGLADLEASHSLFTRHFIAFRYVGHPRDFSSASLPTHVRHSLLSSSFKIMRSSYFTELLVAISNLCANVVSLVVSSFPSASVRRIRASRALFTASNCFSKQTILDLSLPVQGLRSAAGAGAMPRHKTTNTVKT